MSTRKAQLLLASVAGALALLGPASQAAHASSRQPTMFQDDRLLLTSGETIREQKLDEVKALGVDTIKFYLSWSNVAPRTTRKPAGFDGSNPASYSAASLGNYDALVREAKARGLRVLIALTGPAPGWATAKRGDHAGVDRPSGREFGRFARAMGAHYDGAHGVPRVNFWTAWNEPNNPRFLYPAATRHRIPYSPRLYRSLVQNMVKGLRASGHAHDTILFGELLPVGKRKVFRKNNLSPLLFMREMFCLDGRYHRLRGSAAGRHGCRHFHRFTGLSGFAYHPYARATGPSVSVGGHNDATIARLGRVTRVLDRAYKRKRYSKRRSSLYISEFGFQSNPPDRFQTKLSRIPAFLNESEWIAYRSHRVAYYSQYLLDDEPLGKGASVFNTWQGGLRFTDGRAKPGVYNAFRTPIFVNLLGPNAVGIWGAARGGGKGSVVQLQQRGRKGGYKNFGRPVKVGNTHGYFSVRYRISKASKRRFRFTYTSGGSRYTSRSAKAALRF